LLSSEEVSKNSYTDPNSFLKNATKNKSNFSNLHDQTTFGGQCIGIIGNPDAVEKNPKFWSSQVTYFNTHTMKRGTGNFN